jgi:hypothetical protein
MAFQGHTTNADVAITDANPAEIGSDPNEDKNALYKRIHQRHNPYTCQWETCSAPIIAPVDTVHAFFVYVRGPSIDSGGVETLVQIHSERLKTILKSCLKNIDELYDTPPIVLFPLLPLT